jgi:hypothetical protein
VCNGKAQVEFQSGGVYKGDLKDNLRHGQGVMVWADGTSYDGHWEGGLANGRGKIIHPDGLTQVGLFEENLLTVKEAQFYQPGILYRRERFSRT